MDLARGGDHHADRGGLAAARARSRTTDVAERVLAEHEVGKDGVGPVGLGRRGQRAEELELAAGDLDGRGPIAGIDHLGDHSERGSGAHGDALRAALALGRVDEEAELRGLEPARGGLPPVLRGLDEVGEDVGGFGVGTLAR